MKIDITSLDIEVNFWQVYPEFKVVEPFSSWYQEDKSNHAQSSSKKMWFLALGFHPSSTISNMEIGAKTKLLSESYMKDKKFWQNNEKELLAAVPIFLECTSTATQRHLLEMERLFDNRSAFIREQQYDLENFIHLDKMFAAAEAIQKSYGKLKAELAAEAESGASRGSKNLSAGDLNLG